MPGTDRLRRAAVIALAGTGLGLVGVAVGGVAEMDGKLAAAAPRHELRTRFVVDHGRARTIILPPCTHRRDRRTSAGPKV
jgi:hypothetical protein